MIIFGPVEELPAAGSTEAHGGSSVIFSVSESDVLL